MQMQKRILGIIICSSIALFACTTQPEPQPKQPDPAPHVVVPPPEPEPVIVPEPVVEEPTVKVTQEEYDRTFAEVEAVINELNTTIKAKNIRKWEDYLTPKFRSSVLAPQNLAELNETPLLKRKNITISTLKDYFEYVVVPSRANVRLDDLVFTDEKRVQAFMVIREESVLIYQLEKINNTWKISVW